MMPMPMASVGSLAPMPQTLTHINTDGIFIKVWGIVEKDRADFFRDMIDVYNTKLADGFGQVRSLSELIPGKIVLAFYHNQFQRAEIMQLDATHTRKVIVFLIDLGIMTQVDVNEIRLADTILSSTPRTGFAEDFILQGVIARKQWNNHEVDSINSCLGHCTEVSLVGVVGDKKIVQVIMTMNQARINLSTFLVEGGLAENVSNEQLTNALRSKYSKTSASPMNQYNVPPPSIPNVPTPSSFVTPQQTSIRGPGSASMYANDAPQVPLSHTYQRIRGPKPVQSVPAVAAVQSYVYPTLPVDSTHDVVVSHVIDGMNAFTVQLKKCTDIELPKLMARINDIRPVPITEQIGPGALCLGRFVQDNSLCRAVVSNVLADGASLYFVDFGNTEIVPFNEIYRIPPEFLQEPTMALRFTLADLQNNYALTTSEAHSIFANLVLQGDHGFKLKVVKPTVPTQQRCELFIIANGKAINIKTKILDKVKLMKPVEYKKTTFKKNQVADVTVTFADSPLRFFIQLELNQAILEVLMKCVEDYCINSENKDILYTEDIVENMAVCAPYEDGRYYRGLIVDEPDAEGNITVFYVDYGNTESVHYTKLRIMNNEMMSQFPTQAVECRLDIDPSLVSHEAAAKMFIELADGESFKMTVKNILPGHVLLVDLMDSNGRNLADHLKENFAVKSSASSYASPPKAPLQKSSSGNWREKNNSNTEGDFSSFRDERSRTDSRDDRPRSDSNSSHFRPSHDDRSRPDSNSNHFRPSHDDRGGRSRNFEPKRRDSDGIDTTDDVYAKKPNDFWGRDKGGKPDNAEPWRHDKFNNDQANDRHGGPRDRNDLNRGTFRKRDDESDQWNSRGNHDDSRGGGERRFDRGGQGGRKDWDAKTTDDESGGGRPKRDGFRERREDGGNDYGNRPPRREGRREDGFNDRPPRRDNNRSNDGGFSNDNGWDNKNSSSWDNKTDNAGSAWDNKEQSNDSGWGSAPSNQNSDRGNRRDFGNDRGGSFGDDSRGRKDGGFRRRDDNFSSNSDSRGPKKWDDDFSARNTVTLLDGFEKGAQIADIEYQPGQQFDSVISWFVSPVNFYLIPNNNADFRQLMEQIQSEYPTRKTLNANDLSPNDHIVARDKDNVIYRATVLRTTPRGVLVTFVDYGNTESVGKNQVWAINPDHCVIPKQAIQCSLHNVKSSDENGVWKATTDYDNYFGKDSFKATVIENVEQDGSKVWMVNLTDPEGLDVADQLVANNLALRKLVLSNEELYDVELFANQIISVFTAFIESSKNFFVHIEPEKADHIATYIQELTATTPLPTDDIVAGGFCLAPSSDEALYRALIMSVNPEEKQAHVTFIDYGDEYDVLFDSLKVLPDYLKTYNAQAVQCCLYDSDSFTDEDGFVQNIADKDLMIKVMEVKDNVLHVKLFDVKGVALPYPVESTETVPVVCQAPVLRPIENVVVSSVTCDKAYLQRPTDQHALNELNNRLFEKYENEAQEKVDVQLGEFYVAKSAQFEAWYRCQLLEPESDKIFYIDYGNTEPIESLLAIRPLDEEFCNTPMCCFGVSTDVQVSAESIETLMGAIQEIVFKALIKSTSTSASAKVELFADLRTEAGKTFADYVVELNCGSKRCSEPEKVYNAFENWKPNESRNVILSAVYSPTRFCLMLKEDYEKLTKLQDASENALRTVLPLVESTDKLCAVRSAVDNKWYRCYQSDNVAVDSGVTVEPREYKKLPAKFAFSKDKYYVECRLDVASPTSNWSQSTIDFFKDLVQPQNELVAKLEAIRDGKLIVDLISNGNSVTELLLNEGLVKYQEYEVTISHAVSLTEFYVQDTSTQDDLFDLLDKLKEGEETWEKITPEEGQIVAAKFPEDDQWYRARVTSVADGIIKVLFIDYGNQSVCAEFRALPEDLSQIPKFASPCTAHPLPENADQLKEKFVAFVDEHPDESYKVYYLNRHVEPVLVMLYFGEELIEDCLVERAQPEPERPSLEFKNVSVVHINSPSSFYVQTETPLLDEVADRLDAVESNESAVTDGMTVGTLYAAKFTEDGVWYRAKAIAPNEVLFVDFGNTAAVDEVRNLPTDLKVIPFLAKHCAFKSPAGLSEWPQVATERFSELACDGNTVFSMNIVEEGDPAFVQMIDNGVSVTDELYTLCQAELTAPTNENDKPSVIISYVTSFNDIWIQDQTPALDELCDELANVEAFDALDTSAVEPDAIVAALFDEDEVWYRAKVLQKLDEGCKVLFIDYGNESDVKQIKSLPEDLAGMPAFAVKTRLSGIPDEAATTWPSSIFDKVKEISENAESFTVLSKEVKDDVTYVSLQSEGGIELSRQLIELYEQSAGESSQRTGTEEQTQPEEGDQAVIEPVSEAESHPQDGVRDSIETDLKSDTVVESSRIATESENIVESPISETVVDQEHDGTSAKSAVESTDRNEESCVAEQNGDVDAGKSSEGNVVPTVPSLSSIVEKVIEDEGITDEEISEDVETNVETEKSHEDDVLLPVPSLSSLVKKEIPHDVDITNSNKPDDSPVESIAERGNVFEVTSSDAYLPVDEQIVDEKVSDGETSCEAVEICEPEITIDTDIACKVEYKDDEKTASEDEDVFCDAASSPSQFTRHRSVARMPEKASESNAKTDENVETEIAAGNDDVKPSPSESIVSKSETKITEVEASPMESPVFDDIRPEEAVTESETSFESANVSIDDDDEITATNEVASEPETPAEEIENETTIADDDLDGGIFTKAKDSSENFELKVLGDSKVASNDYFADDSQSTAEPSQPAKFEDAAVDEAGSDESSSTIVSSGIDVALDAAKLVDECVEMDEFIEESSQAVHPEIESAPFEIETVVESAVTAPDTAENASQLDEIHDAQNEWKATDLSAIPSDVAAFLPPNTEIVEITIGGITPAEFINEHFKSGDSAVVDTKNESETTHSTDVSSDVTVSVPIKIEVTAESSTITSNTTDLVCEPTEIDSAKEEEPKKTHSVVLSDEKKIESVDVENENRFVVESDRSSVRSVDSFEAGESENIHLAVEEVTEDDLEKESLNVTIGSGGTFVDEIESESMPLNDSPEKNYNVPEPAEVPLPASSAEVSPSPPQRDPATIAAKPSEPRTSAESSRKLVDGAEYSVMYVLNPGNFYVQNVSDRECIKSMEERLRKAEQTSGRAIVKDSKVGSMYGAKMGNAWFRVKVLDSDPYHGYNVFCVDYGNEINVKQLFNLPEELIAAAPFATRCGLPLPAHLNKWPSQVTFDFESMTLVNNPVFKLQRIVPAVEGTEVEMVNLTNDEYDVWKQIKEMCVKCEDEGASDEDERY